MSNSQTEPTTLARRTSKAALPDAALPDAKLPEAKLPAAQVPNAALAVGAVLAPCLLCVPRNSLPTIILLLLAAAASLWIGQYQSLAERYLRQHPLRRRLLIMGGSMLLAALAIGPTVSARWSRMDDHELAGILGEDHQLGWGEMVHQLAVHDEVGEIGSRNRVRPVYYIIRYTEAYLWGDNLIAWYAARVLALGGVLALCWCLLWRWLGGIDAGLTLMVFACFRMWGDLWTRIGSSETYAMVGIAAAVAGVVLIERTFSNGGAANSSGSMSRSITTMLRSLGWLAIVLGSVTAMGCKENFLIAVPAVVSYSAVLAWRRRLDAFAIGGTLVVTVVGGFLAWKIVGALAATEGVDIYAKQRSVSTLLFSTVQCLTMHFGAVMLLAIVTLLVLAKRFSKHPRLRAMVSPIQTTTLALTGLLALFVSQFAFYDGFSPLGDRYAFPAAIAPMLMVPLLAQLWLRYQRISGNDGQAVRRTQGMMRLGLVLLICIMGISMQRRAVRHVETSEQFTNEIENVVQQCAASPESPVVFVSHGTQDYEALYSVRAFLRYYHVDNPVFLRVGNNAPSSQTGDLSNALADRLKTASCNGDVAFEPLADLPTDRQALRVGFSDDENSSANIGNFSTWR